MMPFLRSPEDPAYAAPVWIGRQRVYIAAAAEVAIGGLGFLLLGRLLAGCAAFGLRVALVLIIVGAALYAFDESMDDPCIPSTGDRFFERLDQCHRNARYTYYGALVVLAIDCIGSAAWIIWRGEEKV